MQRQRVGATGLRVCELRLCAANSTTTNCDPLLTIRPAHRVRLPSTKVLFIPSILVSQRLPCHRAKAAPAPVVAAAAKPIEAQRTEPRRICHIVPLVDSHVAARHLLAHSLLVQPFVFLFLCQLIEPRPGVVLLAEHPSRIVVYTVDVGRRRVTVMITSTSESSEAERRCKRRVRRRRRCVVEGVVADIGIGIGVGSGEQTGTEQHGITITVSILLLRRHRVRVRRSLRSAFASSHRRQSRFLPLSSRLRLELALSFF